MKKFLQKSPKFYCQTCLRFEDKHCKLFDRYVLGDYNRCFYHSNYVPVSTGFCTAGENERQMKRA